jgi:hypothetical protein
VALTIVTYYGLHRTILEFLGKNNDQEKLEYKASAIAVRAKADSN